ncbi:MAG: serine--tRNA ligase [Armatimonadetes bacterium]|nr:serine--tRNA ligase [Armatimonadota bacterium]
MLDSKMIRTDPEKVRQGLARRGDDTSLDRYLELDDRRRALLAEVEELRRQRNTASEEIGKIRKAGGSADEAIARMREVGDRIQALERDMGVLEAGAEAFLLTLPNLPHESVPDGLTDEENVELRRWGTPRGFDFEPKPHWDLAERLDIIDFARGTKLAGSGFILYKGWGARLERAIINFMVDLHVRKHGYTEVWCPIIANRKIMTGTGKLPKFEFDMYRCEADDLFLNPTAEIPISSIHADEILNADQLPIYYTGFLPSFRREAGAAGKDTRGLIRVHQFDKVEMVKFCAPESSYDELESLLAQAEDVLQLLEIPYKVKILCAGDTGFAATKCYDLEAWSPGVGKWLEVSSCSNCESFQARRLNTRYRPAPKARPEFVHTLNGSGLALPRTMVALLENNQQDDGSISIPEVLRDYVGAERIP